MKKPIHLYIFVILSSIASILRLFRTLETLGRSQFISKVVTKIAIPA
ncbi:TPA: hypothetical protein ACGOVM_000473 [Streptococcus suis]